MVSIVIVLCLWFSDLFQGAATRSRVIMWFFVLLLMLWFRYFTYESGMDLRNEFAFSQWNFLLPFNLLMDTRHSRYTRCYYKSKVAGERRMPDIVLRENHLNSCMRQLFFFYRTRELRSGEMITGFLFLLASSIEHLDRLLCSCFSETANVKIELSCKDNSVSFVLRVYYRTFNS